MVTVSIDGARRVVQAQFEAGDTAAFPFLWLRDNCPSGFHPDTQERVFDLLSVPADIAPATAAIEAGALRVEWSDAHVSRYPLAWLDAHRPGRAAADPAGIRREPWSSDRGAFPTASADALMDSDQALLDWLMDARRMGLAFVTGLADDADAGLAIARRIGFLRETNFGLTFDVISKPNPNNLAYTSDALPLHTDLSNQETPPGFQFLHCVQNASQGGGSVFCDGVAIAEDLRKTDPEGFVRLRDQPIPMRFHDSDYDIRRRDTVIRCDHDGAVVEIRFNAHLAGVFDLSADEMEAYYAAYRAFMAATRDAARHAIRRLGPGDMVVFDNRRVLHGREAFDPSTGERFLRGCYIDRGEWDSRIRVLSRAA